MTSDLIVRPTTGHGEADELGLDLAVLLSGRRVVCVGGGAVTARRVRRFLEAGAVVEVISPVVTDEVAELAASGEIGWAARPYAGSADLSGAWLVHTATGVRAVDAAVAADAEAQRTFCVDASAAARGSAHVLASRRVETPAGPLRVAVHGGGDPRRAASVAASVAAQVAAGAHDVRARRRRAGVGWVALVGGGPGDPGLLTLAGWQALRAADVVVVDRLAPREVLAGLPSDVRVIDVGKAPGNHLMRQEDITETLVREARAGWGVVRLKGGDPYVLGRGGEERERLDAEGIPVRVIPGVTSAIAGPAAAGIPVTHRGLADGFTVVSAHDQLGSLPLRRDHTLVFLMGVGRLASIVTTLVAGGHDPETPAAIVERAHRQGQRTTVARLADLPAVAERVGVQNPAVIVVGDVVTVSPHWVG
ncbi:MAG TPA: uroporphyrinogen-III C-methyltransferase [Propionibacteriaceae bacterium]|nr:uroporphyrinogen-III C-methyltransferase [Propionibacteriaceae bacterium]